MTPEQYLAALRNTRDKPRNNAAQVKAALENEKPRLVTGANDSFSGLSSDHKGGGNRWNE